MKAEHGLSMVMLKAPLGTLYEQLVSVDDWDNLGQYISLIRETSSQYGVWDMYHSEDKCINKHINKTTTIYLGKTNHKGNEANISTKFVQIIMSYTILYLICKTDELPNMRIIEVVELEHPRPKLSIAQGRQFLLSRGSVMHFNVGSVPECLEWI